MLLLLALRRCPLYIFIANPNKKSLSYKILVLRAYILLNIHKVPLLILYVTDISKLRRLIYIAPSQL
jgi:hypothetical protein